MSKYGTKRVLLEWPRCLPEPKQQICHERKDSSQGVPASIRIPFRQALTAPHVEEFYRSIMGVEPDHPCESDGDALEYCLELIRQETP